MKLKRPFHFVASALRSTNPTVGTLAPVNDQLNNLGHAALHVGHAGRLPRQDRVLGGQHRAAVELRDRRWRARIRRSTRSQIDTAPYRAGSTAAAIDLIDQNFFGGEMPSTTRNALLDVRGHGGTLTDAKVRETDRARDQRQRLPVVLTRS